MPVLNRLKRKGACAALCECARRAAGAATQARTESLAARRSPRSATAERRRPLAPDRWRRHRITRGTPRGTRSGSPPGCSDSDSGRHTRRRSCDLVRPTCETHQSCPWWARYPFIAVPAHERHRRPANARQAAPHRRTRCSSAPRRRACATPSRTSARWVLVPHPR